MEIIETIIVWSKKIIFSIIFIAVRDTFLFALKLPHSFYDQPHNFVADP